MAYMFHALLIVLVVLMLLLGPGLAQSVVGRWALLVVVVAMLGVSLLVGRGDGREYRDALRMRSAQLGFYMFLLLGFSVMIFDFYAAGKQPPDSLQAMVLVPLAVTGFTSLVRRLGLAIATRWLSILLTLLWLGFALLSHGFTWMGLVEAAPFVLLLLPAVFVESKPRLAGSVLLLLGAVAFWFFGAGWLRNGLWQFVLLSSLMPLPLCILGAALLFSRSKGSAR